MKTRKMVQVRVNFWTNDTEDFDLHDSGEVYVASSETTKPDSLFFKRLDEVVPVIKELLDRQDLKIK